MFAGLMRISAWIAKLAGAHMLWLLVSAPFLFSVWMSRDTGSVLAMIVAAVFGVAMGVPATAALFGVVRPWVMGRIDSGIWSPFWRTWRELYVRSVALGALAIGFCAVAYSAWETYGASDGWMQSLRIVVLIAVVVAVCGMLHTMCYFVHFRLSFWQSVFSGLLFAFVQPWNTFVSVLVVAMLVHASIVWPGLALFFCASVAAMIVFYQYERAVRAMRLTRSEP
ncbi:MAG: DUF624 domain-containing protein [Paenibacillaceae bacterium]|nr:DUF624 domain-containing protein [Paenibacillaceae bacterium]